MGTANVIPGVSGGTIALIAGIFERLIDAIKNTFSLKSLQLLLKRDFKDLINHIDLSFLISILIGIAFAIISVAKLLEFLFANHPTSVWAFFFGLVMASIFFVGKIISKWNFAVVSIFALGLIIAVLLAFLKPASENDNFIYLLICGAIGISSMILPGISGSFVLVLMGNYELIMIKAVNELNIVILFPVVLGAGGGLLGMSYFLSWIYKKYKNQTIAVLSGFISGSLLIIWPWKETIFAKDNFGEYILTRSGEKIVESYSWFFPSNWHLENIIAVVMIIIGVGVIYLTEVYAMKHSMTKKFRHTRDC